MLGVTAEGSGVIHKTVLSQSKEVRGGEGHLSEEQG